jgi:hypothetical protein
MASKEKFILKVVDHKDQRYETIGDWIPGNPAKITASKVGNPDYEFMILVHELIEYYMCKKQGIPDRKIVKFDKRYEKDRILGKHTPTSEPGNHKKAPYRREHKFATKIEKMVGKALGVDWDEYSAYLMDAVDRKDA